MARWQHCHCRRMGKRAARKNRAATQGKFSYGVGRPPLSWLCPFSLPNRQIHSAPLAAWRCNSPKPHWSTVTPSDWRCNRIFDKELKKKQQAEREMEKKIKEKKKEEVLEREIDMLERYFSESSLESDEEQEPPATSCCRSYPSSISNIIYWITTRFLR